MSLTDTKLIVLDAVGQKMFTIDGEGNNVTILKQGLDKAPDSVFFDAAHGQVYATQMGAVEMKTQTAYARDGSIWRMNTDGSDAVMLVGDGTIRTPKQITADLADGKLYWSDREGMRVMRANLDGSTVEVLVETGTIPDDERDQRHWPVGIAVDPKRRQFYFTLKGNPDSGQGRICRAGYDLPAGATPSKRSDLEVLFSGLPEPIDLHFDRDEDALYWTDRGNLAGGNSVSRVTFDTAGKPVGKPQVLMQDLKETIGLVIDHATGHIFASSLTGELYRARLDGSELAQIGKFGGLTGMAKL